MVRRRGRWPDFLLSCVVKEIKMELKLIGFHKSKMDNNEVLKSLCMSFQMVATLMLFCAGQYVGSNMHLMPIQKIN